MNKLLGSYQNGNYKVSIYEDGTKIRENDLDFFEAVFPESMDLKITNRCTDPLGPGCGNCKFCHENSGPCGKHADVLSPSFIDKLRPYTEIAVGGGNALEHPDLIPFLRKLKSLKMIPSMTVHQNHFMANLPLLRKLRDEQLVYGLGISLVNAHQDKFIETVQEFPNAVVHVINGVVEYKDLKALANNNIKLLILGYKQVRRGERLYETETKKIEYNKNLLYKLLPIILQQNWFKVVSFDNLALNQLQPQRMLTPEQWSCMYMGDDGIDGNLTSASMFVDLVERKFAKNSCDMNRYDLLDTIDEMYEKLKEI